MQTISTVRTSQLNALPLNAKMLRQWCSPEVILVVTDLTDEDTLQLHTIHQARRSMAKVLLVHVATTRPARSAGSRRVQAISTFTSAQERVERLARQLRWSGITCEPIVVRGLRANEIPAIAKSCCADRVIVSAPADDEEPPHTGICAAQELIESLDIPTCVVGRNAPIFPRYQRPTRRITLMVSLGARNEAPIAFASRFAQENQSSLALMHVYPRTTDKSRAVDHVESDVIARLPREALREAELFCPLQIVVREGDAADQLLKYDAGLNQDFIILAPPGADGPIGFGPAAVHRVIRRARCPVFVVRDSEMVREGARSLASNAS